MMRATTVRKSLTNHHKQKTPFPYIIRLRETGNITQKVLWTPTRNFPVKNEYIICITDPSTFHHNADGTILNEIQNDFYNFVELGGWHHKIS